MRDAVVGLVGGDGHLLRARIVPEAWIAPPECRQAREPARHRAKLVALRSGWKSQVNAVLATRGVRVNHSHRVDTDAGQTLLDHLVRRRLIGPPTDRSEEPKNASTLPTEHEEHSHVDLPR